MSEAKKRICEVCGGNQFDTTETTLVCRYCSQSYPLDYFDSHDEEEKAERDRQTDFQWIERTLDDNPPDFDAAETGFAQLQRKYPTWSAVYWGELRAKYGIKYEYAGTSRVPCCYKSTYEDFRSDDLYQKALQFAETPELKQTYMEEAVKIADYQKISNDLAQKHDYDIFISFKQTDDETGEQTKDSYELWELYQSLTEAGYKVFFSPVSMKEYIGTPNYEPVIFNALQTAEAMIVYGSQADYFKSTWVKNEWSRFMGMIAAREKAPSSLIVVYKGMNPRNLPPELRHMQSIDFGHAAGYKLLFDHLASIPGLLPTKNKSRDEQLREKEEQKERERKEREEKERLQREEAARLEFERKEQEKKQWFDEWNRLQRQKEAEQAQKLAEQQRHQRLLDEQRQRELDRLQQQIDNQKHEESLRRQRQEEEEKQRRETAAAEAAANGKCSVCGKPLDLTVPYCRHCGSAYRTGSVSAAPRSEAPSQQTPRRWFQSDRKKPKPACYCKNCGANLEDGETTCPQCGKRIEI